MQAACKKAALLLLLPLLALHVVFVAFINLFAHSSICEQRRVVRCLRAREFIQLAADLIKCPWKLRPLVNECKPKVQGQQE